MSNIPPTPRDADCVHPLRTLIHRDDATGRDTKSCQICGAVLTVDRQSGRTLSVEVTGR